MEHLITGAVIMLVGVLFGFGMGVYLTRDDKD